MGSDRVTLLGRLRRAVNKLKFLINFNIDYINRPWSFAPMIGALTGKRRRRRLSFNDRPGLRSCSADITEACASASPSPPQLIQRTASFPLEEDVDKRADAFIENFHRQLRLERQISLELRYCRANSFDSNPSPSSSASPV
ncbi:hypothetical protein Nepgr_018480 [Nepenthes gracilis]|uniref:Uncharacterized protein n=1 Tax=Nepenthes gracilis TaxID=150966 RepID=A0AAD3STM8_NEPGR|nr:hypothetical protein Nepgr_018480 [Nepenthes gracilis]